MAEIDLLRSLPKIRRNVMARAEIKDPRIVAEAQKFGEAYFDGPRSHGYGGYHYDGRWVPVARDIVEHYVLTPGMRVLDVGCAKGFLVRDLMSICPGLDVYGIDISDYAVRHGHTDVIGRLHVGNCINLPFPDNSFDAVLSINVIHNLDRDGVIKALKEIIRVSRGDKRFVQVDSYHNNAQKELFCNWVLTARFHDFPQGWFDIFAEAGYTGDWAWTVVTE